MPAFKYSQITRFILLACCLQNIAIMSASAANYSLPLLLTNNQTLTLSTKDNENIVADNPLIKYGIMVNNGAELTVLANQFNATGSQLSSSLIAQNGGIINIGKDSVINHNSTSSGISHAITVQDTGSVLNINEATINSNSAALVINENATANMLNTTINANNADNAVEVNTGATLNATGLTVNHLGGMSSSSAIAINNADATLLNTSILSQVREGISIDGSADRFSNVTYDRGTIVTDSDQSNAVAVTFGNLQMKNVDIHTLGQYSNGLMVQNDSVVQVSGGSITTQAAATNGVTINGANDLTLADGLLISTPGNASVGLALNADPMTADQVQKVRIDNATINSGNVGISKIYDGAAQVIIDNASLVLGINAAMTFADNGASTVNVSGKSQIIGNIINGTTAKTDVTLDGSVLTGAVQNLSSLTLNNQSVWNLTGDSVLTNLSMDNSLLNFTQPQQGQFHTLNASTLSGNGSLNFNTQLGSDNSPTDLLHVQGNASGQFGVLVRNVGGSGALTTGDGIRLVQVDGADTSSLKLLRKVSAGAYDYYLYKGGSSSSKDWYLRTYLEPVPPPEPVPDPDPAPEPTPQPTPIPKPVIAYRTDVVGYIAAPFLNRQYGFSSMGSYHERTGDSVKRAQDGTWARIGGAHDNYDIGRFSFDSDIRYIQIGKDLYQDETPRGNNVHAGIMISLGDQKTNSSDSARGLVGESTDTGDVSTDAYGIGGYYTVKTDSGAYLDFVGQVTDYHTEFQSETQAKQDGYGVALSAEGGIPFAITQSWRLEPQTQVIYQYLHMKGFNDGIASVEKTTDNSVQARAGVRLSHLPQVDQPNITPYLNLDAVSTFSDAPAVTIASTRISPDFTQSTWKAGGGITATLSKNAALYASANYLRGFDGKQEGYQGNIGINVSFK
ncbi:autotransporter family protein [Rahnella variigena]|uniref:Autotransporter outer membrane beta-barrel domain-containing protein n=1 Tax=Rahnella variigena TaxID=574964 RepID=A0ABX9PSV4_9GAMM|nr:autotransporter outer membrane beta-barrel domain-containing protein [Rahnella variigena]RJT52898.1 autotransporter outer membrane beta-barrel domain-containing protein [Rahnella variigena]RKF67296.1 autotransporter outer membrane beta-barrel domain-containing protein [Rahnella variigena]